MTLEERSDLILAFAKVLYANGQSTDQTLAAATRLGDALGLRVRSCHVGESCSFTPMTRTPN
jgi:hypothetical protein